MLQFSRNWKSRVKLSLIVTVALTLIAWGGVSVFGLEIPFEMLWASSGHADIEAEAFTHWNEEDPPEIPQANPVPDQSRSLHKYLPPFVRVQVVNCPGYLHRQKQSLVQ